MGVSRTSSGLMKELDSADDLDVVELELLKLVRHLETFGRRSSLYQEVDRAGYLALRTLDGLGPSCINRLAQELHLDSSTVTRQVGVLESGGLVTRHVDPNDGRSWLIDLTSRVARQCAPSSAGGITRSIRCCAAGRRRGARSGPNDHQAQPGAFRQRDRAVSPRRLSHPPFSGTPARVEDRGPAALGGRRGYSIGRVPMPVGSRPASTHPMRVAAIGMAITMRNRLLQGT